MTSMRDLSETIGEQQAEIERLREEVAEWRRAYEKGKKREIGRASCRERVSKQV